MSSGRTRPLTRSDEGAAVVDFVLVTMLLLPLFVALLQLGLVLHVRNTLMAAASEGARYAANADREPRDGVGVTRSIVRDSLADRFADDVTSGRETVDGVPTVFVQVSTQLPLVGWFANLPGRITVRAHAVDEAA